MRLPLFPEVDGLAGVALEATTAAEAEADVEVLAMFVISVPGL